MTETTEASVVITFGVGEPWTSCPLPTADGLYWLPECSVLLLTVTGEELSPQERAGLTSPLDVAVLGSQNLVGLGVFIQGWGWQDTLIAEPAGGAPDYLARCPTPQSRFGFNLVVVVNGVVEHIRLFTISPHASRALSKETRDRWTPLTNAEFAVQWDLHLARFPTTKASVLGRCVARSKGGA